MLTVVFSPKASADLDEIKAYIESELGSPKAANEKVLEILDAIDNLSIFPEIGGSLKGKIDSLARYRRLSVAGCLVFYRIEAEKVLVVRILNSRMDYLRILN
ncbi:type II toxin-antitoxin system RelE/ParE family toxin [Fibrobacter sp.]|uniref:type II toxin-antitoxin system RelE/ParE family toxin n=1 Tax=Fibrobacter sp. TaxID=35828 RepID=UPI00386F5C71